jgi:hypothetical protein
MVAAEYPSLLSMSVVPIGVSDFSTEKEMRPPTPAEASAALELVGAYASLCRELFGRRIVVIRRDVSSLPGGVRPASARSILSTKPKTVWEWWRVFPPVSRTRTATDKLGTGYSVGRRGPGVGLSSTTSRGLS